MDVLWRDAAWESEVPIVAAVGELVWTSEGVLRVVAAAQACHGRMVWLVDTEAGQWVSALGQMVDTNSAIGLQRIGPVDTTSFCGCP
jgi:hypothetical protein